MILELADIPIKPGTAEGFEAAMQEALELLAQSEGFHGAELARSDTWTDRYRLLVRWRRKSDHQVGWQHSAQFQQWRALLRPYFACLPEVEYLVPLQGRDDPKA